jgi:hypothetical protein
MKEAIIHSGGKKSQVSGIDAGCGRVGGFRERKIEGSSRSGGQGGQGESGI